MDSTNGCNQTNSSGPVTPNRPTVLASQDAPERPGEPVTPNRPTVLASQDAPERSSEPVTPDRPMVQLVCPGAPMRSTINADTVWQAFSTPATRRDPCPMDMFNNQNGSRIGCITALAVLEDAPAQVDYADSSSSDDDMEPATPKNQATAMFPSLAPKRVAPVRANLEEFFGATRSLPFTTEEGTALEHPHQAALPRSNSTFFARSYSVMYDDEEDDEDKASKRPRRK